MSFSLQKLSRGSGGFWDLFCNHDAQHHLQDFLLDLYFLQLYAASTASRFLQPARVKCLPQPFVGRSSCLGNGSCLQEMRVQGPVSDSLLKREGVWANGELKLVLEHQVVVLALTTCCCVLQNSRSDRTIWTNHQGFIRNPDLLQIRTCN